MQQYACLYSKPMRGAAFSAMAAVRRARDLHHLLAALEKTPIEYEPVRTVPRPARA
jgi:hypothetical protein